MPASTCKTLLFDLGGVLIESEMFFELKRLMNTNQPEAELIEIWLRNPIARKFELGQCSVNDFSHSIIREFQLAIAPHAFLAAFKSWPKGFYPGVKPMLRELRTKSRVCCLSNSNEAHWSNTIADQFDFAFSSHLMGRIKPDHDAFEHVLETIGAKASEVYFFDDAQMNVEAAQAYGMHAHHTVGYDRLRTKLIDLGFLS